MCCIAPTRCLAQLMALCHSEGAVSPDGIKVACRDALLGFDYVITHDSINSAGSCATTAAALTTVLSEYRGG